MCLYVRYQFISLYGFILKNCYIYYVHYKTFFIGIIKMYFFQTVICSCTIDIFFRLYFRLFTNILRLDTQKDSLIIV